MKELTCLFGIVLLASFVFADLGPAPPSPDVTVKIIQNGEQYTGPMELVYHCNEPARTNGSNNIIEKRDIEFACSKGICKNDAWLYKFNPCFYPKSGYFRYSINKNEYAVANKTLAGEVGFKDGGTYKITMDLDKGVQNVESSAPCLPFFGFFGLLIALFARNMISLSSEKKSDRSIHNQAFRTT